jgi:Alkylmercury lyase
MTTDLTDSTANPGGETDDAEQVRRTIYRALASTGRAPERAELAAELSLSAGAVDEAFDALAEAHHLVLDADGRIVLAHPFATRSFAFSVMGARTLWWGGCAWDSFAIPHLVPDEPSVLVATTCPACDAPLAWTVDRSAPPAGPGVAHFLVPVERIWDDVVHTCSNQRIFCGEHCVEVWLARTGNAIGSVFGLDRLWHLAEHWYEGRLDSPYRRREPAQALDYFRGVGLTGAFWGTPELG